MANSIYVEIVTPERVLWRGDVTEVTAPGFLGEFGVLPEHAAFVTSLQSGPLFLKTLEGEDLWAAIHTGYFEILDDRATVLAARAELADEIDVERAEKSKDRAEKRLEEFDDRSTDDKDVVRARASLTRALIRTAVATKR